MSYHEFGQHSAAAARSGRVQNRSFGGWLRISLALALGLANVTAGAQSYPARAVRIVVPVGAGGATDILSRAIAQQLTAAWGQQVIVDNRPGGGSNVGFDIAARAAADGYTLLMAQPAFTVNVSLYRKLPYHPLRDFAPITLAATGANVLVVHPSVPARSLQALVALAKSKPGQLSYASSGNGTTPHLSAELFKSMAHIDMVHIPYKGAGAAAADLLGGHVDLALLSLTSVVPQLKSGKLRALAITSAERSALMPDLPTFAESGLRGFEVTGWYGLVAPAGTPRPAIDHVNASVAAALKHPEVLKTLGTFGLEPARANSPEQFGEYLRAEIDKWARVVKQSGARAD
jgi:tripartite-type tricarboxylate transporter receptor subunit TctC